MPDDPSVIDARDERIAGLLAVEPLDDVTRRRLVTTAMRSTGTARRARALIAAAAIVCVAVAGAGVLVAVGGGNDTTQTAARDKVASPQVSSNELGAAPDTRDVGDFGELTVAANLQRLRAAVGAAASGAAQTPAAAGADKTALPAASRADAVLARLRALGCSTTGLPRGPIVALATGTYDGHDVIVVETETSDGTNTLHAVETGSCTVHRLS